jgi:hypothetical protein
VNNKIFNFVKNKIALVPNRYPTLQWNQYTQTPPPPNTSIALETTIPLQELPSTPPPKPNVATDPDTPARAGAEPATDATPWAPTPQITFEDARTGSYAYSPPKAKFKNGEVNPWTHVRILRTEGDLPESIRNRDKVRTP